MESRMYRTSIPKSSRGMDSYHSTEVWSLEGGLRRQASQVNSDPFRLLPADVFNFQAREQPQLQRNSAANLVGCPTQGSSGHIRQSDPQWQQKNAAFSEGMESPWQPKKAANSVGSNGEFVQKPYAWERKLEKGISQLDKGTRSLVHESSKEFGRMLHEQLQEFAMILTKEYNYKFPTEFFDDYYGDFNKEAFLGIEQPRGELKEYADPFKREVLDEDVPNGNHGSPKLQLNDAASWMIEITEEFPELKKNSPAKPEKIEEELTPQEASTERVQEESGEVIDEVTAEIKANSLPLATNTWTDGLGGDLDQNSVRNGIDSEVPKDIVPLPLGFDNADDSLSKDKRKTASAEGSLADLQWSHCVAVIFEEGWKGGRMAATEEPLAGFEVAALPNSNAYWQPWSECQRQGSNAPLLHFQYVYGIFVVEHDSGLAGNAQTAARHMCLPPLLVWDGVVDHVLQWETELDWTTIVRETKKKRSRWRKKERGIKQTLKTGIG